MDNLNIEKCNHAIGCLLNILNNKPICNECASRIKSSIDRLNKKRYALILNIIKK